MAGHALGAQLQPDELLLGDRDAVDERVRREQIAAAEPALVYHIFGIELGVVVRDHPPRAERAADLLVGLGQQNHVARERHALALQPQERDELGDARPLHVHRAARPQLAAPHRRREGIGLPLRAIGRHDVHVVEEHHRLAGGRRRRGLQPRVENRLPGRRLIARDRNPFALEDRCEEVCCLSRVARRIRRVDLHI